MVEVYPRPGSAPQGKGTDPKGRERTVGVYDQKKKGQRLWVIALILIVAIILTVFLFSRARGETARELLSPGDFVVAASIRNERLPDGLPPSGHRLPCPAGSWTREMMG
jgi:hypothetical protein